MSRLDKLDAYVTGEMTNADAGAFEEALFESPDDGDLAFIDRLALRGAKLVEHGTWDMGVTKAHVDNLIAAGHTIHIHDVGLPGTYTVTFDRRAELMLTIWRVDRTDLERVDVEVTVVDFNVTKTIKDARVENGTMYALCERPLAEIAFGAGRTIVRARRSDGARDVIGEWDITPRRT